MFERAKIAAKILHDLGWDIEDDTEKTCYTCKELLKPSMVYCHRCGSRMLPSFDASCLADLEKAIAAAHGGYKDNSESSLDVYEEAGMVKVAVTTRNPQDYVLTNVKDRTRWRIENAMWVLATEPEQFSLDFGD